MLPCYPVTLYFANNPPNQSIHPIAQCINHPKDNYYSVPTKGKHPVKHKHKPNPHSIFLIDSPTGAEAQFTFTKCLGQTDEHLYSPFCSVYFEISVKSLIVSNAFFFPLSLSCAKAEISSTASEPKCNCISSKMLACSAPF